MRNRTLALTLILLGCSKTEPPAPAPVPAPAPRASAPAPAPAAPAPPPPPVAAGAFEGEITLRMKTATAQGAELPLLSVKVKGAKLRIDLPEDREAWAQFGKRVHAQLDATQKQLFAVLDDRKQVVALRLDHFSQELDAARPPPPPDVPRPPPPLRTLSNTGQRDSVAGRPCEEWELASSTGEKTRLCMTEEAVASFALPSLQLAPEHAWARALLDGRHMPLRAISFDASGNETTRIEVTKLERHAVDDASFALPQGYATLTLAQLMESIISETLLRGAMLSPDQAPGGPGAPGGPRATPSTDPRVSPQLIEMMKRMRALQQQQRMKAQGAR